MSEEKKVPTELAEQEFDRFLESMDLEPAGPLHGTACPFFEDVR